MAASITDDIAPYDLSRFTTSLTKNILDKNDGKHYDGSRNGLRRWYKATIEALDALGLDVDEVIRDPDFEDYEDVEFDEDVSVPDRKFIYNAVGATLTSSAKEEAENDNQNGLKLIQYFHKLWASRSLSNNIAAFRELIAIKVPVARGRKAVGSRAVCEMKWDKLTGMLDKAKSRRDERCWCFDQRFVACGAAYRTVTRLHR